jgi:hypothetical protein
MFLTLATLFVLAGHGRAQGDLWVEQQKLTGNNTDDNDDLGSAVAIDGSAILVGAPGRNGPGLFFVGALYVFEPSGSSLVQTAMMFPPSPTSGSSFGAALGVSGNTLAVGAPGRGTTVVYTRSGPSWVFQDELGVPGEVIGSALALDGDTLVLGVPSHSRGCCNVINVRDLAFDPTTGTLYGVSRQRRVIKIDPQDGGATLQGATQHSGIAGLTFDSLSGVLFATDTKSKELITFDASGIVLGALPLTGHTNVPGLAFDSNTGTLYGYDATSHELITIDPATAAATTIGPVGFTKIRGLAYDTLSATLYGSDFLTDELVTIDTTTGAGTAVGPLGVDFVRGLAFDPNTGMLHGSHSGVDEDWYLRVNPATGAATAIGNYGAYFGGAAFVFRRSGTVWTQEAMLQDTFARDYDRFGTSLALEGNTLVVGAPRLGPTNGDLPGRAYVFVDNGTAWEIQASLEAGTGGGDDRFGESVALSGATLLVGATKSDVNGLGLGAAYAYTRAGTVWSEQAVWSAYDSTGFDGFGASVAIEGDRAAVGANVVHSVYSFQRSGTAWAEGPKSSSTQVPGYTGLGSALALEGATLVAGAPQDTDEGFDAGAAHVFAGFAAAGPSYCTAGTSADGCRASIAANGAPSASLSSGFFLSIGNIAGDTTGLFFVGTNGRQANPWGNGTSFQCVVPPVKRGGMVAGTTGFQACEGWYLQDLNALWCPTCPKPGHNPGSGVTAQAQFWYRDGLSTSNQTTSLSDATEFTLAP